MTDKSISPKESRDHSATAAAASSSTNNCVNQPSSSAPPPRGVVVDIEDMRYVYINGDRRPRPPVVPYLCPFRRHLEPGKIYRYCTCGRSKDQPWCDDSHEYDDPQPIEFSVEKETSWHLICACKYSAQQPFCDGSHIHVVEGYEEEAANQAAVQATSAASTSPTASTSTLNHLCSSVGGCTDPVIPPTHQPR